MRSVKLESEAAASVLKEKIDQAVALQAEVEEKNARLKAAREEIKALLAEAQLQRFVSTAGNEAVLIERTSMRWNVDRLLSAIPKALIDVILPRRVDAGELDSYLKTASDEDQRAVRACGRASKSVALELRRATVEATE